MDDFIAGWNDSYPRVMRQLGEAMPEFLAVVTPIAFLILVTVIGFSITEALQKRKGKNGRKG